MKVRSTADAPAMDVGYCTNIHAGESWTQVADNVATHVLAVKARVCPDRPFGVGLRLSARAAAELEQPSELERFQAFLGEHGLYVFTINGFPYGPFHGEPVKANVYRPDWTEDARVEYSDRLARVLAALLPAGHDGTISTVPGAFRPRATTRQAREEVAERLLRHAVTLVDLHRRSGVQIALALEPEPHCLFETSHEAVAFFEAHLLSRAALTRFGALSGLNAAGAEAALRRHVGVCLDACHAAVEFEEPEEGVAAFAAAGISVAKLQVSAGLRVVAPNDVSLRALEPFAEGVYLHQTVVRKGNELRRHLDLPEALAVARAGEVGDEWRVHFHVPVFLQRVPPFENTQPFLRALLDRQRRAPFTRHLEVETYTWDVLPDEHRRDPVDDAIARELRWTLDALGAPEAA